MATPLTDSINALTRYANETTGASDTTLSDAVESLVAGYGQGGSSYFEVIDRFSFAEDTFEYTFTHSGAGLYVFCEEPVLTLQKAIENNRRNYSLFSACFYIYGTASARAGTSLVYKSNTHSVDYWGTGVSISGNNATIKIKSNTSANIKFEAGINYMILKMST